MSTFPVIKPKNAVSAFVPVKKPGQHDLHIVGLHIEKHGDVGLVWLGLDKAKTSHTTIYDSYLFRGHAHLAIVADRLKLSGEWKPIAYRDVDSDYAEALRERGCKPLFEGYDATDELMEVNVLKLKERMENGTFSVLETNTVWIKEYQSFNFQNGTVPQTGAPLICATLHAFEHLKSAKAYKVKKPRDETRWGGAVV